MIIKHVYTRPHTPPSPSGYIEHTLMISAWIKFWYSDCKMVISKLCFLLDILVGILLKGKLSLLPNYFPFPHALINFLSLKSMLWCVYSLFDELSFIAALMLLFKIVPGCSKLFQWNCPEGGSCATWSILILSFKHFCIFWHKMSKDNIEFSLFQSWNQPFIQEILVYFCMKWYLDLVAYFSLCTNVILLVPCGLVWTEEEVKDFYLNGYSFLIIKVTYSYRKYRWVK